MNGEIFLIVSAVLIALIVGFVLTRKKVKKAQRAVSQCGETPHPGGTLKASAWHIGPKFKWAPTKGSIGMPDHPTPNATGGWYFDFPVGVDLPLATGPKVGYLTFNHGPLTGKREIRMRYRVDAEPGVEIRAVPEDVPESVYQALITPYFQVEGDNWSGNGEFETYRWWAKDQTAYVMRGEHELVISLERGWGAVSVSNSDTNPAGFAKAKANACCLGFVFGGNDVGYGHGARATGPAKFTLLEFTVS